jgi:hypothetical protein
MAEKEKKSRNRAPSARQVKYVLGIAVGKTKKQSALDAGILQRLPTIQGHRSRDPRYGAHLAKACVGTLPLKRLRKNSPC